MRRNLLLFFLFCFTAIGTALGQNITVKGTVLDENSDPVMGATVRLKSDATKGAITDLDGKFTLQARSGETLVITYVGYQDTEIAAAPNLVIRISPDDELLEEVVIIGYGSRKITNTSASVVKVSSKDLQNKPTANILEAAQGKVAGLQVYTSSGEPSEISSLRLHGAGSLTAGSTPLYVLDGMPVSAGLIQSLNPEDFESMQFLKDAAATSIYGARAANGVVYITTKRGKMQERATINFKGQYGISTLANSAYYDKMMNTEEFFRFYEPVEKMIEEAYGQPNYLGLAAAKEKYGMNDTKWWKYFYQDAPMYQADLNISGGSERTNYYISAGYLNQKGLRQGSEYQKANLRANLNSTLNSVISVGLNTSVSYDVSRVSPDSYASGETFAGLQPMLNEPYYTPYKEDGSEYYDEPIPGLGFYNPKYSMSKDAFFDHTLYLNLAGNATITPFENFQIRSRAGVELSDYTRDRTRYPSWVKLAGNGSKSRTFGRTVNFTTNNVAEYKFNVAEDNHFSLLVGQEYNEYSYFGFSATGNGISDDRLTLLSHTTKDKTIDESYTDYAFLSFFGQFSYDYAEKYFLDLVLRNDASSRFGANKRNGLFWSAGLLWKAKKEEFLQDVDWINTLDFKLSYGTQGNADIGNYQALDLVGGRGQYKAATGWGISQVGNPDLSWENQDKFTIGVTADLWDRLHVNFEFYNRVTRDMLMSEPFPYSSGMALDDLGFASIMRNVGKYQNRGFDLTINGDVLKGKDYGISLYANMNYNRDKVLELFQGRDTWILPNYGFGYIVGEPVTFIYPIYKDVDPETGLPRWYMPKYDENGQKMTEVVNKDDNDLTNKFDATALEQNTGITRYPPFSGGFGLNAFWKGFSLQADFAFVLGKYMIANESYFTMNPLSFFMNSDRNIFNYWKQPGDIAEYPSLDYQLNVGNATEFDSKLLSDASFMRLKNLTIGYEFQKSLLKRQDVLKAAKIYFTARNLWTLTNYNGHDPEVDSNLSRLTNPNTKQFVVGIELGF